MHRDEWRERSEAPGGIDDAGVFSYKIFGSDST
jgi:hypothetical protein